MLISGKIARLFKFPGFVNIDYLIEQKIYVSPSVILNALTREWRKWRRPAGFNKAKKVKDILDPTFGYETIGGSSTIQLANRLQGWRPHTCPESGTAQSISIYVKDSGEKFKLGIYKDSDDSLVDYTSELTAGASAGWVTGDVVLGASLENTDYILAFLTGDNIYFWYDQVSDYYRAYQTRDYSAGFPDPANWVSKTYTTYRCASIYCTYTTVPAAGFRKLQYYSEPPAAGAWNKLKYASEPPVAGAWNKLLYEGES